MEPLGAQGSQAPLAGPHKRRAPRAWKHLMRTLGLSFVLSLYHVHDARKRIRSVHKGR